MDLELASWYNNQAIELWNTYGSLQKLIPLQVQKFNINAELLIIGMNPSFNMKWIDNTLKKNANFQYYTSESLFEWSLNNLPARLEKAKEFETYARDNYKVYFHAFDKFANNCNLNGWEHLDLFLIRETNQKAVLKAVGYSDGQKLNEFGENQIKLLNSTIEKLNPKVIVVLNATASTIISRYLKKSCVTLAQYNNIPVFFAGMLSGQRAMDKFSKQRLIDEINSR